jgi:hypothetical protein
MDCFARDAVLLRLSADNWSLERAAAEGRQDRQVVLAAVTKNGYALGDASAELRADRQVVAAAVTQDAGALRYASEELQADPEVLKAAAGQSTPALRHAWRQHVDRHVVLAAVKSWPSSLQFASAELQADREVVLAAVARNGSTLRYASAELQRSAALKCLSSCNVPWETAKRRLALACVLLPRNSSALSSLPSDVIGLAGVYITVGAVAHGIATRQGYWGARVQRPVLHQRNRQAVDAARSTICCCTVPEGIPPQSGRYCPSHVLSCG